MQFYQLNNISHVIKYHQLLLFAYNKQTTATEVSTKHQCNTMFRMNVSQHHSNCNNNNTKRKRKESKSYAKATANTIVKSPTPRYQFKCVWWWVYLWLVDCPSSLSSFPIPLNKYYFSHLIWYGRVIVHYKLNTYTNTLPAY